MAQYRASRASGAAAAARPRAAKTRLPRDPHRYASREVMDKLGVKTGAAVRVVGAGTPDLLDRIGARTGRPLADAEGLVDLVLYWPESKEEITRTLRQLAKEIVPNGGIWVISSKKGKPGPGATPYLPDAVLIPLGLAAGLVDNKICSVSETETALRFVIRRKDRPPTEGKKHAQDTLGTTESR